MKNTLTIEQMFWKGSKNIKSKRLYPCFLRY